MNNLIYCNLTLIPATDGNYKSALERATNEDLEQAIHIMQNRDGKDKSRILACQRELKKRLKGSIDATREG